MRSALLAALLSAATLGMAPQAAQAEFPDRPVTMIVGFSAGGGTDTLARLIAADLQQLWGQSIVVENQPGASGSIAAAAVSNAAPDGYTIAVISNAHTITPSTLKSLPYDPVKDFEPITMIASQPNFLLLHPSIAANNVKELVDLAKSKPGALTFGSAGASTTPHLAMERIMQATGTDMVAVPYKGSAPAVLGIISGEIDLMFGAISTTIEHVKKGEVKAIAVSTKKRIASAPDVPTVDESGIPGFEAATWYGILAPAGTPKDIVDKLNQGIVKVLTSDKMTARLEGMGFQVSANSPQDFKQNIVDDIATWSDVVAKSKK